MTVSADHVFICNGCGREVRAGDVEYTKGRVLPGCDVEEFCSPDCFFEVKDATITCDARLRAGDFDPR